MAGGDVFVDNFDAMVRFDDVFTFELHEIVASMWTFHQGMLGDDIINSRMLKFPIDKIWHARYILQKFESFDVEAFCQIVHILTRLLQQRGPDPM